MNNNITLDMYKETPIIKGFRQGLVPKTLTVTRGGVTYQLIVWVNPNFFPSKKKEKEKEKVTKCRL